MRRLNVRSTQIDECIRSSMFAIGSEPKSQPLESGELLLLQLVKNEAEKQNKLHSRVEFALVFDHLEKDVDGSISRKHWPDANREWDWIVYGSATIPTIPFSLDDIELQGNYTNQTNPVYISELDEQIIKPYIQGTVVASSDQIQRLKTTVQAVKKSDRKRLLQAIQSYDSITSRRTSSKKTVHKEEYIRNAALSESLKAYYDYRCQICGTSLGSMYGNVADQFYAYVDTHHIQYLSRGGQDVSSNMIVVCPNHHRIIHATDAFFNRESLMYEYANGISEKLILADHFEKTNIGLK